MKFTHNKNVPQTFLFFLINLRIIYFLYINILEKVITIMETEKVVASFKNFNIN